MRRLMPPSSRTHHGQSFWQKKSPQIKPQKSKRGNKDADDARNDECLESADSTGRRFLQKALSRSITGFGVDGIPDPVPAGHDAVLGEVSAGGCLRGGIG